MEQIRLNLKNGLALIKSMEKVYEMWKPIKGYDNYSVSSFGRVRNDNTKRILKPKNKSNGYLSVNLCESGKVNSLVIHRLVASHFINNKLKKPFVDHINGDKTINAIYNLRWCTNQENQFNRKLNITNSSGIKGVSFAKQRQKWKAYVKINGKNKHLGYFTTKDEATIARQQYTKEIFGEFQNKCEIN